MASGPVLEYFVVVVDDQGNAVDVVRRSPQSFREAGQVGYAVYNLVTQVGATLVSQGKGFTITQDLADRLILDSPNLSKEQRDVLLDDLGARFLLDPLLVVNQRDLPGFTPRFGAPLGDGGTPSMRPPIIYFVDP